MGLRQRRRRAQRVDRLAAHLGSREGGRLSSWQALDDELDRWRASGRRAQFWLRDDDATRDSPALDRLLEIATTAKIPVALAVIPALGEASLVDRVEGAPTASVLQHGYAHRNHAPPGGRSWELGSHRPLDTVIAELGEGRTQLAGMFERRFLPVLVPPWNRIDPAVTRRLPQAGFQGLSTFGPRSAMRPHTGLVQCNTHVDLIAWRRGRIFIGAHAAIERLVAHLEARREGAVDASEPTGVLTHHLDFDDDAWQFLSDVVVRTNAHGAATWIAAERAFDPVTSDRSA